LDEANVFALGIGKNVNRHCIEGMAAAGQGEPWIATNRSEALRVSSRLIQSIALPVLTDIEFDFDGMEAYDLEPPVQPDLFADRPLTITGKFRGDAARAVTMTGRCGEKEIETVMEFERKPEKNKGLPFLWARERLRRISDFQKISPREDFREEITNLGLTYQLVTKHTSFVAVEREIPDLDRLNKKLGKGTNPAPEPSTALFTLTSLGWLMLRRRRRQS
ncbi:MAG: PEP-CTERM sorting domain-containing protein, partial [Verrucomicrobiota bacterium]